MTGNTEIIAVAPRRRAYAIAVLRLAVVALVLTAIVATCFDTLARTGFNPFNFFGFCTMQGIIITVVVLFPGAPTTAGWPYPFPDPATGYGTVALYCLGIAISRLQLVAVTAPRSIDASGTGTAAVPEHDHQG